MIGRAPGPAFVDESNRAVNHGQGLEPKEIKLDQPDFLHVAHGILRHDFVVGPFVKRHVVGERLLGDDHPGGVRRGVPRQPLQRLRRSHQLPDLGIGLGQLAQAGLLPQGIF